MKKDLSSLSSEELIQLWKSGNQNAAEIVVERYSVSLIALVTGKLSRRLRRATDPEDVAQSAMGSFFEAINQSRVRASQLVSVWGLLVTIAKRKVIRTIERESAAKRSGDRQRVPMSTAISELSMTPSNENAGEFVDELRELVKMVSPQAESILDGLLAGKTQKEIAEELGVSDRTVRRVLTRIRDLAGTELAPAGSSELEKQKSVTHESSKEKSFETVSSRRFQYRDFVIGNLVGQGTFGKVYRAKIASNLLVDKIDSDTIAVKFLRKYFWQQPEVKKYFLREVDMAAQVCHPNVVQYFGWGESPHGGLFLLQQFVDGKPLSEWADTWSGKERLWLKQICDGLAAIHSTGVTHGDLSPNNILVRADHQLLLTDLGYSVAFRSGSKQPNEPSQLSPVGTLGFAAPEQLSPAFGKIGTHTDVYSLGAIIAWYLRSKPGQGNSFHSHLQHIAQNCLAVSISNRPSLEQIKVWIDELPEA